MAGFAVGALAVVVAVGGGAASAFFTSNATAQGEATTARVEVTTTNFASMDATLINTHTTLTKTGSFTVKNSGTASGTATASITSPDALALKLPLTVWPTSNVSTCTPTAAVGAGSVTQTVASLTMPPVTLAAGASQAYCARITVTPANRPTLQSTAGDQSAKATLNATLNAGGWTAQATAAIATQKTDDIYPLDATVVPAATASRWFKISNAAATLCLDGANSGSDGAAVITYQCTDNANQRFKLVPVDATSSLVTIAPKHTGGVRLAAVAGTAVLKNTDANSVAQRWYLQKVNASTWQLVSADTGKCLPVLANEGSLAATPLVDCTDATAKVKLAREPLKFAGGWLTGTFDFSARQNQTGLTVQKLIGANWVNVRSMKDGTKVAINDSDLSVGRTSLRVVLSGKSEVLYEGIVVEKDWIGMIQGVAGFE